MQRDIDFVRAPSVARAARREGERDGREKERGKRERETGAVFVLSLLTCSKQLYFYFYVGLLASHPRGGRGSSRIVRLRGREVGCAGIRGFVEIKKCGNEIVLFAGAVGCALNIEGSAFVLWLRHTSVYASAFNFVICSGVCAVIKVFRRNPKQTEAACVREGER